MHTRVQSCIRHFCLKNEAESLLTHTNSDHLCLYSHVLEFSALEPPGSRFSVTCTLDFLKIHFKPSVSCVSAIHNQHFINFYCSMMFHVLYYLQDTRDRERERAVRRRAIRIFEVINALPRWSFHATKCQRSCYATAGPLLLERAWTSSCPRDIENG
jgi:hypothetical protein